MEDEPVDSEIVTKFLLNTCQPRPQLSRNVIQGALRCAEIAMRRPDDDVEVDLIPLTTGSVAEFYIEPILAYVGDIDVMYYRNTYLAISRGHPPPTQLPAEFHNYVKVHEIIDSHLPGYVYLHLRYLLTYCNEEENYSIMEYEHADYYLACGVGDIVPGLGLPTGSQVVDHGPALQTAFDHPLLLKADAVPCVHCLSWPPQAADWPRRQRNYDWPDSATVDRILNNGCDVVNVAHRQCRQHDWMGKVQRRLSFSRAEIVLLNSWMPVQQIAYHMLRVFLKTERLTDSADNSEVVTLSNYHIKTLMLWVSELNPRSCWTNDINLVQICVELLHTLSAWLYDRRCQHYFVDNWNLIDNTLSVGMVTVKLMSVVDETYLSSWFVENYIAECAKCCLEVNTSMNLQNMVSAVVEWRTVSRLDDLWAANLESELQIALLISMLSLTLQSTICWKKELAKIDARLTVYFSGVAFLQVAFRISRNGFSDELMDIVTSTLAHLVEFPRHYSQRCSMLFLRQATKMLKLVTNKSHSTVKLIEIELAKAYLHRALRCKDSDSDSIYCLANVYLAALYYTTGQYQTAIDHCTLVLRSQDHSQCSSHVVQRELIPKIDSYIDRLLGLAVFYQYVLSTAFRQQRQHSTVFTTELFACYLYTEVRSVTERSPVRQTSSDVFERYEKYVSDTPQLFISDVLIYRSRQIVCNKPASNTRDQFSVSETKMDTSQLVQLLQRSAVEHLTTFRLLQVRQFASPAIVATDFEALYAYKCGDYRRCLQLSMRKVRVLMCDDPCLTSSVYTVPVFLDLFDDDIVSLTALTLIVSPSCRQESNYNMAISQLTLSLYLTTRCQLKLRHSLASLAWTLYCIRVVQRWNPIERTINLLTLKLASRKIANSDVNS